MYYSSRCQYKNIYFIKKYFLDFLTSTPDDSKYSSKKFQPEAGSNFEYGAGFIYEFRI
jgi:hypothetical protein